LGYEILFGWARPDKNPDLSTSRAARKKALMTHLQPLRFIKTTLNRFCIESTKLIAILKN
jgi:hypothetical protein